MKTIRLGEEDRSQVREVYNAFVDALEKLPDRLRENERFAGWAVMAIANLVCCLFRRMGMSKENLLTLVGEVWDGDGDHMPN